MGAVAMARNAAISEGWFFTGRSPFVNAVARLVRLGSEYGLQIPIIAFERQGTQEGCFECKMEAKSNGSHSWGGIAPEEHEDGESW
jgi:hypothetical protein